MTERLISGIVIAILLTAIYKLFAWLIGFENTVIIVIAIITVLALDAGR